MFIALNRGDILFTITGKVELLIFTYHLLLTTLLHHIFYFLQFE